MAGLWRDPEGERPPWARMVDTLLDRTVNPDHRVPRAALTRAVSGKVVLVTGASYGLGEATARALAEAGATVLAVARTAERLDTLSRATDGTVHPYPCDLTDFDSVGSLADRVLADHGRIDVVVNNAGKSLRRSLSLQYDRFQDFTRLAAVNYLGPVRLLLGLLPHMRERGTGHVVNVSTIGVRIPPGPRWGSYQASKGAFDTWLRSVTPELAEDGVAVSTVYMGLIFTRMSAPTPVMRRLPGLDPEEAAGIVARALVGREREIAPWWVRPAQIPEVVGRRAVNAALRALYRNGRDTPSALGTSREVAT